jgi:hypothetical protein
VTQSSNLTPLVIDTDDPDWDAVRSSLHEATAKSRGYAGYWEWAIDRPAAEKHAAQVLVRFLRDELAPGTLASWQQDPPDVVLTGAEGRRVGIEVTELVSGEMAARHRHLKKRGLPISCEWAHWTPATIAVDLTRIVSVKEFKLKKARGDFSKLLLAIVTDEPMIDEAVGRQAINLCHAVAEKIDRAFLILSYLPLSDPSHYPDQCPVLEIPLHCPGPEFPPIT